LAKARIQYDQDMQYAQKRANMGFWRTFGLIEGACWYQLIVNIPAHG
jgi:hypothetical protein